MTPQELMVPLAGALGFGPDISKLGNDDLAAFHKALTAGYGSDVAALSGGGALRLQSIEPTLLATIQEDKHFAFINRCAQSEATATVDEYTVESAIGGFLGGSFVDETGVIAEATAQIDRKVGFVKFMMTRRQVSVIVNNQKGLVKAQTVEKIAGARQLKTDAEWCSFYGDDAVNAFEFPGAIKQIEATGDTDLIIDAAGGGLSFMAEEVLQLCETISSGGRFGTATDIYCSNAVKRAEFDQKLDPSIRVMLTNAGAAPRIGTPVRAMDTSWGEVQINKDVFIRESEMPFEVRPAPHPAIVTAAGLTPPTTVAGVAASNAASKFLAGHAGNYFYAVESVGKLGRSLVTKSAQVAVVAGDRVTVTITNPVDTNVTGYVIHRSRRNGTNATNDFREVRRIPKTAGATTVFLDDNLYIPGTSHVFVFNQRPGDDAITLRRMFPMMMFPLYPTVSAVIPWAQILPCYLRMAKPRQHGMVRNVLPKGAIWRPF